MIFVNKDDEIITVDVNITMEDTEGIYSDGNIIETQLKCIGYQWLPDENRGRVIDAGIDISAAGVKRAREAAGERLKSKPEAAQ